jgi:hypothetical protein
MIITDLRDKIKGWWQKILPHEEAIWWLGLVVIGSMLGVGIYQLVTVDSNPAPITIERGLDFRKIYEAEDHGATLAKPDYVPSGFSDQVDLDSVTSSKVFSGQIVASKNGTRYYYEHCAGVKRIKEANKIYFNNEAEAITKGLTLAANCR